MIPTLNDTQVNALYAQQNCFSCLDGREVELPAAIEPYEFDLWVALHRRYQGDKQLIAAATDKALQQARQAA
jgi:hypothetical protein